MDCERNVEAYEEFVISTILSRLPRGFPTKILYAFLVFPF
jgi:hypothetical protein